MVNSRVHKDSIKAILEDTVDIQEGLVPQPLVPWHFEYSDPTQAIWYHDLEQTLLDESRALSVPQKTVITQEMMDKLKALGPQSIVEEMALKQGLPVDKIGDFPYLKKPVQRTLYDFIDIEYQYSDGTKLLTPTSRFLSSKGLAIPLPKYRFTIKHVGKTVSIIYPIKTFQVSIVSFLEPSLGLVFLEKVSEVHFSRAKLASNILERIWLNGKTKSGARPWGIIYLWVNSLNDNFMYGRTEQRPLSKPYYPVGALSFRFDQYIARAIHERRTDDSIYGDMYRLYVKGGEGQDGINNIIKYFKVSIVEVIFLTGNYDYDCNYIEAAEESYIKKALRVPERAEKCYNKKESGKGSHKMTEEMLYDLLPVYTIDTIEPHIIDLMKNGYSTKIAASKLPFILKTHKVIPSISASQLNHICNILFEGKTYRQKRDEVLLEHIDSLIEQGYITPYKIADKLAGFNAAKVFNFLARYKSSYIIGLTYSYLINMVKYTGKIHKGLLAVRLGAYDSLFLNFYSSKIGHVIKNKDDLLDNIDLINRIEDFDAAFARRATKICSGPIDLLEMLGYHKLEVDLNDFEFRNSLFKILFNGLSFQDAMLNFAFRIL